MPTGGDPHEIVVGWMDCGRFFLPQKARAVSVDGAYLIAWRLG